MKNLGELMKQAQELQTKVSELQGRLAGIEVTGTSGGGMVEVMVNGKGEARRVRIDPGLIDPKEIAVVEDLIVAAFNDARAKAEARAAEEMAKLTGGLGLPPGFKLPM
ncbi:MAG: YbaB/EbfC family nucleoid-associated protein [Alphaproteobacteria bacterium]